MHHSRIRPSDFEGQPIAPDDATRALIEEYRQQHPAADAGELRETMARFGHHVPVEQVRGVFAGL